MFKRSGIGYIDHFLNIWFRVGLRSVLVNEFDHSALEVVNVRGGVGVSAVGFVIECFSKPCYLSHFVTVGLVGFVVKSVLQAVDV